MNILFLSTRYPYPPDSGHYLRTFHTLKYLAKDNKIFFLSFLEKNIDQIHPEIRALCESVNVYMLPEDDSKIRLFLSLLKNFLSPLPFVAQKYFDKRMLGQINYILDNEHIDIVHVDLLPLSGYLPFFRGITACLTEHNVEYLRVKSYATVAKNPLEKFFFKIQALKLKRYEKKVLGKYRRVFCVSKNDLDQLEELTPEANYKLIPNAVDIKFFSPGKDKPHLNKIIWTGGAGEIYNRHAIRVLVDEIMPEIRKLRNDIKLVLIGNSIDKYFSTIGGSSDIELLGYVDDVRPYLNDASIFVAPIFSGGGTKLKILNAMAMGIAVITTDVGAEGIGCEDGVHYLNANSPYDFACKICALIDSPEKIDRFGGSSRAFIEKNFTWDSVLEEMNCSELT